MAASVIKSNGIANDLEDQMDGLFLKRRMSVPMFETSECVANFNPATSKKDFPLHHAVFQGDLKAVQELVDMSNVNSLDTHGKYKESKLSHKYVCKCY